MYEELIESLKEKNKNVLIENDNNNPVLDISEISKIDTTNSSNVSYASNFDPVFYVKNYENSMNQISDYIIKERMRYKNIYSIIEAYCKNNNLIIGNIYKILGAKSINEYLNYCIEIYTNKPFLHSNNITNEIFQTKGLDFACTVNMKTLFPYGEYSIEYDLRTVAKVYSIQHLDKSVDIMKALDTYNIDGNEYLPAEIEAIEFYHRLYMGNYINIDIEDKLFNKIKKKYDKINGGSDTIAYGGDTIAYGGDFIEDNIKDFDDIPAQKSGGKDKSCYEKKKDVLEAIKIDILRNFIRGRRDIAVLGTISYNWLIKGDEICPNYDKLQIITTLSLKSLRFQLNKYLSQIGNYNVNPSKKLDLKIPKDFRTGRSIFTINIVGERGIHEKPFMEIVNIANFEAVPCFMHKNILICSRNVSLRFLFIDLWINEFLYKSKKSDKFVYEKKFSRLWPTIKNIYNMENKVDGFLGIFYDYEIAKKITMQTADNKYYPYYPFESMRVNETLRTVK